KRRARIMNKRPGPMETSAQPVSNAVPFYLHGLTHADGEKVAAVLGSSILTSGQIGRDVEAQLCDFFAASDAKLTNSWTNGAVAVLLAMGVGPGDEVIVPAMTFIATANVVELVGATPVFVDVDPATQLIDLSAVRAAITDRTRVVMPVHLYGQMVDVAGLREITGPDIAIIEDCAHAFESNLGGMRPAAHSDAAIFSFYATKNITCGEGGAIVSNNAPLMDHVRQTVLHGMSAGADRRFEGALYKHWEMARLGTKANLPDLLASLLPEQIRTVEGRRQQREDLVTRYRDAFADLDNLTLVAPVSGCMSAHHLFAIAAPFGARDRVMHELNAAGVGATVNYRAVHTMQYYDEKYGLPKYAFPHAYDWGERTLSLPLFPGLTADEQEQVIATVKTVFGGLDQPLENRTPS
ncbi:MAG: DegT/DnrJ/EryC1/StrS family aminotransferase, partial [Pseudomonadota bacterium]